MSVYLKSCTKAPSAPWISLVRTLPVIGVVSPSSTVAASSTTAVGVSSMTFTVKLPFTVSSVAPISLYSNGIFISKLSSLPPELLR